MSSMTTPSAEDTETKTTGNRQRSSTTLRGADGFGQQSSTHQRVQRFTSDARRSAVRRPAERRQCVYRIWRQVNVLQSPAVPLYGNKAWLSPLWRRAHRKAV